MSHTSINAHLIERIVIMTRSAPGLVRIVAWDAEGKKMEIDLYSENRESPVPLEIGEMYCPAWTTADGALAATQEVPL